jgi:hypothetical protein
MRKRVSQSLLPDSENLPMRGGYFASPRFQYVASVAYLTVDCLALYFPLVFPWRMIARMVVMVSQ